jgi:hypothetical protein
VFEDVGGVAAVSVAAVDCDKMMNHHVLEVVLDEYTYLAEGNSEVMTKDVGI